MKRIGIILFMIVSAFYTFALETKKVAILEVVDKEDKLSYHQKLMLRAKLAEEINKSVGFEAYDRANVDAILSEHNFQRTGLVSSDQIRQLGKMAGANYILLIEGAVSAYGGSIFVSATLLDVETAQMVVAESQSVTSSESGLQQGCAALAKKLFATLKTESEAFTKALQEEKAQYYIYQTKNSYTYLDSEMDKKAYAKFLKNNCSVAYKKYKEGSNLYICGWTLLCTGVAFMVGGVAYYGYLENKHTKNKDIIDYRMSRSETKFREKRLEQYEKQYADYKKIGYAFIGIGGGIAVTSIPLLCIGTKKQKQSVSIYNEQCASPSIPPLTFNLTAGQNGLGVAMNF